MASKFGTFAQRTYFINDNNNNQYWIKALGHWYRCGLDWSYQMIIEIRMLISYVGQHFSKIKLI